MEQEKKPVMIFLDDMRYPIGTEAIYNVTTITHYSIKAMKKTKKNTKQRAKLYRAFAKFAFKQDNRGKWAYFCHWITKRVPNFQECWELFKIYPEVESLINRDKKPIGATAISHCDIQDKVFMFLLEAEALENP